MNKQPILFALFTVLAGCSAKPLSPDASHVIITTELPPKGVCVPKGEVSGSQGNWFTGDFTANENLMIGARNEMKNQAAALGGNVIVLQAMQDHSAWGSAGTTAYTMMGMVFRCNDVSWTFERLPGSP